MTRTKLPAEPATHPAAKVSNGLTPAYLLSGMGMLLGLGASLATYAFLHEPLHVALEHLTIHMPKAKGRLPAAGLRILHLSDTHFQGHEWREQAKINCIRQLTAGLEYDLLIHTGDFWHYEHGLPNVLALLDALPKPRLGSYGVLGNHDYTHYAMSPAIPRMWQTFRTAEATRRNGHRPTALVEAMNRAFQVWRFGRYVRNTPLDGRRVGKNDPSKLVAALGSWGMQVLHNQACHINYQPGAADGVDLYLAGVDDVQEGRPHLGDTLTNVPADAPVILLSHNPDILQSPRIDRIDLILAGHTHGGQIVLPLWGPAHTQAAHLERANVAGYVRRGKTQIYITRGIGEGIPLRFGAKPQITLITVKA